MGNKTQIGGTTIGQCDSDGSHQSELSYHLIRSPYVRFDGAVDPRLLSKPAFVPRGVLVGVRPRYGTSTMEVLGSLNRLQQGLPWISLVLWLDLIATSRALAIFGAAWSRGVRGCVPGSIVDPAELRRQLTDVLDLPVRICHWLCARGLPITLPTAEMIEQIVSRFEDARRIQDLALTIPTSSRQLLRRAGLTVNDLFQILRLVRIGVELQARPAERIKDIATRCGYWDDAALRKRLRDVLGETPRGIRQRLGVEWLLHQALSRAGVNWSTFAANTSLPFTTCTNQLLLT